MFDERVFDKGITVNLRLMDNPRCADRRPLINTQDLIIVGGEPLSGDNQAVGENARPVGEAAAST